MAYQLKIVGNSTNALLNRREVQLEIIHSKQSSPSKTSVTNELATNYSLPKEQIYVYDMTTMPGLHKTVAKANMYNSFDDLKNVERSFVVARITGEKQKKIARRLKKDQRIKKYKRFGTLKRVMKKAARRSEDD